MSFNPNQNASNNTTHGFVIRNDEGVVIGYANIFKNTDFGKWISAELDAGADDIHEVVQSELHASTIEMPIEKDSAPSKDYRKKSKK